MPKMDDNALSLAALSRAMADPTPRPLVGTKAKPGGLLAALPLPWPLPGRIALVAGGALVAGLLCWLVDLFRCHRRARRFVRELPA